ncbi:transposase [Streptomyces sp. NPDC058251]|uniref:transposase n=1 Tax=Streptomyces sp. NPDC058251 TaxID=3346404 RepID=UPI0036E9F44A
MKSLEPRILAELGDDRSRFADGRALKAYAGSAPITRASGKSLIVHHRKVKNQRLAAVGYVWSFAALFGSRSSRPLRPPPKYRGPAHSGLAQPLQPARPAPPLSHHTPELRREHRLPHPATGRSLTP